MLKKMLPAEIRALRTSMRFSQSELAQSIGVSAPAISQWETGTTSPTEENLRKLQIAIERRKQIIAKLVIATRTK